MDLHTNKNNNLWIKCCIMLLYISIFVFALTFPGRHSITSSPSHVCVELREHSWRSPQRSDGPGDREGFSGAYRSWLDQNWKACCNSSRDALLNPVMQDSRTRRRAAGTTADPSDLGHHLIQLLPSARGIHQHLGDQHLNTTDRHNIILRSYISYSHTHTNISHSWIN